MPRDECAESYRECTRARSERIKTAISENPTLSDRKIAGLADCDSKAVRKHRKKMEDLSSTVNRVQLRGRRIDDLRQAAQEGKRWGCIYADPPWLYDNQGTRAATNNHYEGMTVTELCSLPVGELAADAAHLHLWTTNGFLFETPRIFSAWGFVFKSSFVWVKPDLGIGNYWRNSHEFLLTAVKGDAKHFNDHSFISWMQCGRGAHSAKPERVREMLERASPGPYLELFARSRSQRWDVWGDQVEPTLFAHAAE